MSSAARLSFTLLTPSATRGGAFKVRLSGDPTQYRSVRLELLLVERKPKAVLDAKANNAKVVNKVDVVDGQTLVDLGVPADLPNTYRGTQVGWDYEVRLVGDRAHLPDLEVVESVNIDSTVPVAGSDNELQLLCRSRPAHLAGLTQGVHEKTRAMVLPAAAAGVIGVTIGLVTGWMTWVIGGAVPLAFAGWAAFIMFRARRHSIEDVLFERAQMVTRLGEPVVLKIGNAIGDTLEAGVKAIEISVEQGRNRPYAVPHVAYEQWKPITGATVSIPTRVDHVPGYAGEQIAVHWVAVLRKAEGSKAVKAASARTIPLAVTH